MSAIRVYAFRCDEPGCREVASTLESSAAAARRSIARRAWTTRRDPNPDGFYFWKDFCPSHSEAAASSGASA
jgi:hypothetical protein